MRNVFPKMLQSGCMRETLLFRGGKSSWYEMSRYQETREDKAVVQHGKGKDKIWEGDKRSRSSAEEG